MVSGMTKWLKQHRFSYKKPKAVPEKANAEAQEEFIEKYLKLLEETRAEHPLYLWIQLIRPWPQRSWQAEL